MKEKMKISFISTNTFCLVFLLFATFISAQSPPPGITGFSCATSQTSSCDAYAAYVAQSPGLTDIKSIAELFGVTTASIAEASNLVSEDIALVPGQLLLIPLICGCNGSLYFANVTHTVKPGDTYYFLSLNSFENLTDWHEAEAANPGLKANSLHPGDKLVFPLFCGCPLKPLFGDRIRFMITYVWRSGDDVPRVAAMFNASQEDIIAESMSRNLSIGVGSPVLIPVSRLPVLSQPDPKRLEHRSIVRWIVVGTVSSVCVVLVLVIGVFLVEKRRRVDCKALRLGKVREVENFEAHGKQEKLLRGVSGYLGKPKVYEIRTIMEGTMNLNAICKIGGSVYKAMIDGKFLAVKKAKEDFTEELKILQKVNHGNLVSFLGISLEIGGSCFFVFEFVENGSLDTWLQQCPSKLSWQKRLHVALDVAHGLQYMHEHAQPSLVHRGISTTSILLDAKLKAKISDFSKAGPAEAASELKEDVFAFGVVLFELLSGEKTMPRGEDWNVNGIGEESVREWIDPNLEGSYKIEVAMSLMVLAKACTQERAISRPTMGEIVFSLSLLIQAFSESFEGEELVQLSSSVVGR